VSGDFLSPHQNTPPIFTTKKSGHEGIETAAERGFTRPSMPHHYDKASIFNLAMDILKGGPFASLVRKCQIFNRDCSRHPIIPKS
jgi:hypothetical protein